MFGFWSFDADRGYLPNLVPGAEPWVVHTDGTPGTATLVRTGVRLAAGAAGTIWYRRPLTAGKPREDRIVLRALVQGRSSTPGPSGNSPIWMAVSDGDRMLVLAIGDVLAIVDPGSGDVIREVANPHPFTTARWYRVVKHRSARWEVWVDGRKLLTIPYLLARAADGSLGAFGGWGIPDVVGAGEADFDHVRLGRNMEPAFGWRYQRALDTALRLVQDNLAETGRSLFDSLVGAAEDGKVVEREAMDDITAERHDIERSTFVGDLPLDEVAAPWTLLADGTWSTVRGRQRMAVSSGDMVGAYYTFDAAEVVPDTVEHAGGMTVHVRSYTPDADGRIGPFLYVQAGAVSACVELLEDTDGVACWRFTDGVLFGTVNPTTDLRWIVDPLAPHRVEVLLFGEHQALLVIDGKIVDRMPWADLNADPTGARVFFGAGNAVPGSAAAVADVEDGYAVRRLTDLDPRPVMSLHANERLIFTSGCDRNDELDEWRRRGRALLALRGTLNLLLIELRRLACCEDVAIVRDERLASWYLELSYPEITPVFLEVLGAFTDTYIEFCNESPIYSDQALADLATRYLVPLSLVELRYFVCVAETLTNNATAGGGGTRLPIAHPSRFAIGDTVTVRNAANTASERSTVIDVEANRIVVETLDLSFVTGDVVRKTVAHT